jgi:SAM-dependent methyltransferase
VKDAMVEEFDTMATWTADAVVELGEGHALPAACRGSGSPAALDWLGERLRLGPGTRLLDSGAGLGGPAEYVASRFGLLPTLVEPMEGACRAAVRLFGRPVVVADGAALPFPEGTFDAAWSLGVLCTVEDKTRHLAEMARTVREGAMVGLLVFTRMIDELPEQPDGNRFPTVAELDAAMRRAGLEVQDEARIADFPASPDKWQRAADRVTSRVERDHRGEDGLRTAHEQEQIMADLIETGLVVGRLLACRAR